MMTDATTTSAPGGKSRESEKERGINPFYSGSMFFWYFHVFGSLVGNLRCGGVFAGGFNLIRDSVLCVCVAFVGRIQ